MIKIPLCPIPECDVEWSFIILEDLEDYRYVDDLGNNITAKANLIPKSKRPYIKSEVTNLLLDGFPQKLKDCKDEVKLKIKNNIKLKDKTVIEKNHSIQRGKSFECLQIPCAEDILKIKQALGL